MIFFRLVIICFLITGINLADQTDELLFYTVPDGANFSLKVFDPTTQESRVIVTDLERTGWFFVLEQHTLVIGLDADIYTFDVDDLDAEPVNIMTDLRGDSYWPTQVSDTAIVFSNDHDEETTYYRWRLDGALEPLNINLDDLGYDVEFDEYWFSDTKLAISTWYLTSPEQDEVIREIYIWEDGEMVNLSQNPDGYDWVINWSPDGQLAFYSERGTGKGIYVWDGVSMRDGVPDADSFELVAPHLKLGYFGHAKWTHDNQLAFLARESEDQTEQIYVWDGETATNITEDERRAVSSWWASNGNWAFVAADVEIAKAQLVVRDSENQTLFTFDDGFHPAWSNEGNLAFCEFDIENDNLFTLYMRYGDEFIEVEQGYMFSLRWQSGGGSFCFAG